MDGEITIGTRLDTDKFDRQITQLEKKMQKEENKKIIIDAKLGNLEQEFEIARKKTDELEDAYQRLEQLQKSIASGTATPKQFTMAQDIQNTYGNMKQLELSLLKALNKQDALEQKAQATRLKYQEINDKVAEYKQRIESINLQKQVAEADKLKASFNNVGSSIKKSINNVGSSIKDSIKNVARLALSIFGIRSAISGISRASSELSSYDKQYAANLEYIRFVLTQAIAPVLRWIISLVATLLGYINTIVYRLFGINLFSKGSAENFNKMKSSAGGVSKAVKEIKKQLSGFDEINMLTDQSNTGTSSGISGVSPNMNLADTLSNIDVGNLGVIIGEKINEALEHIPWDEIKEKVGTLAREIASGINDFIKTVDWQLVGKTFAEGLNTAIEFAYNFLKTFDFEEFGRAIADTIGGFFKNIDTKRIAQTLSEQIKGKFDIISGLFQNFDWKAILDSLINFVKGIDFSGIADAIFKALGSAFASMANLGMVIGEYLKDAFSNIGQYFYDKIKQEGGNIVLGILKGIMEAIAGIGQWIYKHIFIPFINGFKQAFGIHSPSTVMQTMGNYIVQGLVNGLKNIWNSVKSIITQLVNNIKSIFSSFVSWINQKVIKPIKNAFSSMWSNLKSGASKTWEGIKKVFSKAGSFFKSVYNTIKKILGKEIKVNIYASAGGGTGSKGYGGGGGSRAHGGIYYPSKLPRLAAGGIINQPGRGVPYNGAIIGERGAEAVVPLTDNEQMELLGATIGKYITINANVINTMNGRVISRELKQIKNEQDFAFNN